MASNRIPLGKLRLDNNLVKAWTHFGLNVVWATTIIHSPQWDLPLQGYISQSLYTVTFVLTLNIEAVLWI